MNYKIKKIFTNWRVLLLLFFLLATVVAIQPNPYNKGAAVRNVIKNSSASLASPSFILPTQNTLPMQREVIQSINNVEVTSPEDYYNYVKDLPPNRTLTIITNKDTHRLITKEKIEVTVLDETINKTVEEIEFYNETINDTIVIKNRTITKVIEVPKTISTPNGTENIGLKLYEAPKTNIQKGLDLQGGTRVLLAPEKKLSQDDMDILIANMKERLNVYGLSDLTVVAANDLSGNQYILVEIAGATEEEVKTLIAKQGKFEAKIGNSTVFKGGDDVKYVCRSADCAGIDPNYGCRSSQGQSTCRFRFSITLSQEAAQRQSDATKDLQVVTENQEQYLSQSLELFLDNEKVDELRIGADLKGRPVTDISISGSGIGNMQQEAVIDSMQNMKRLQTILVTGSLPAKVNIIKMDSISPVLGEEFLRNAIFIGMIALLVVILVIFLRFRKAQIVLPMFVSIASEVVIILGIAALIHWNLDLAAIAGIIIAVGTGVDHLIIITDETLKGEYSEMYNWKKRIKNAFFIIIAAFFTTVAAMLPLINAGAGLLRGFAITTIIGICVGVFITRPAYSAIIEILLKD